MKPIPLGTVTVFTFINEEMRASRPVSCREFNCWWRAGLVDGKRPDKCGIVVDSPHLTVRIWEAKPGALR